MEFGDICRHREVVADIDGCRTLRDVADGLVVKRAGPHGDVVQRSHDRTPGVFARIAEVDRLQGIFQRHRDVHLGAVGGTRAVDVGIRPLPPLPRSRVVAVAMHERQMVPGVAGAERRIEPERGIAAVPKHPQVVLRTRLLELGAAGRSRETEHLRKPVVVRTGDLQEIFGRNGNIDPHRDRGVEQRLEVACWRHLAPGRVHAVKVQAPAVRGIHPGETGTEQQRVGKSRLVADGANTVAVRVNRVQRPVADQLWPAFVERTAHLGADLLDRQRRIEDA